jgi:hypothetical protein
MSVVGMATGGAGQSDHGVAVDADESFGLADATAFVEVGEDRVRLLVGEPAVEQGRTFAFGEASLAGVAVE